VRDKSEEIAQLGHPILRQKAEKITDVKAANIVAVIAKMKAILEESNGVGIAAPQIFESLCLVIIASKPSQRYPLAPKMDAVVMINPSFEQLSPEIKKDWEGCLSIPEIRALVPRYTRITIQYWDEQGRSQKMRADDFIARIFQHEYDHLEGRVYLDRIDSNLDIISESEFQKKFKD
jgi:peptide deformylase